LLLGEILGLAAGLFTTVSIIPQIIKVFKLRSAREISLLFNIMFLLGGMLWLSYGIIDKLLPVIVWNSLATVLVVALLVGKLKYGKGEGTKKIKSTE
jgi:MtN3 and saliva related transmembrane protein